MSAICAIVREGIGDYLADALPAPQRRILREHLAACAACREEAVSRDASLVFARRIEEDVTPEETAGILAAVRTGVAHIETERRLRRPRRVRAAAVAAAVALVALLAPAVSSRRDATPVVAGPVPAPQVAASSRVASSQSALEPAAAPAEGAALPSNATVYELNPGAGREEPRVVWIVDRGLDI